MRNSVVGGIKATKASLNSCVHFVPFPENEENYLFLLLMEVSKFGFVIFVSLIRLPLG